VLSLGSVHFTCVLEILPVGEAKKLHFNIEKGVIPLLGPELSIENIFWLSSAQCFENVADVTNNQK